MSYRLAFQPPWPISLLLGLAAPSLIRLELPTAWKRLRRQHGVTSSRLNMAYRPLPPSPSPIQLLLVGSAAGLRTELRDTLAVELPRARITEVPNFSDAVMQLARGGVHLVVLDLASLSSLSAAAPLLLRGLAPGARVVAVGPAGVLEAPGLERVDDLEALLVWLRGAAAA